MATATKTGTGTAAKDAAANGKGTKKPRNTKPMSASHKAALAEGREWARIVKEYLTAIELHAPKRGRKVTPETMRARIEKIDADLPTANAFDRLLMTQQRADLEAALKSVDDNVNIEELEEKFVAVCAKYAARKGISYGSWRAVGVPADLLKKAGVKRTRTSV